MPRTAPDDTTNDDEAIVVVAGVLDVLDASDGVRSLADLADGVGWHPDHLARVFRTHVGVSPSRYQQHLRAETGRRLLAGHNVLDATIALGESSPGRVHDLLVTVEAVTPGEARRGGAGMQITHGLHPTPLGPLFVATTARGVVMLAFTAELGAEDALGDLAARWPRATLVADQQATAEVAGTVRAALAGRTTTERPLPLLLKGTNLQLAVWRALLRLPEGVCVPYGVIAEAVGNPTAVRAVASAIGRNPVAPLVPCHRVLRATGALGGYRWGLQTKQRLLAIEAARSEAAEQRAA